MKLTHKFTLGIVLGVLVVHVGHLLFLVERERALFYAETADEERVLGRALTLAAEAVAERESEERAIALVEEVNQRDADVVIRWVWLDSPSDGARAPHASRELLAPLARGEPVVTEWRGEELALYAYAPLRLPSGRAAAIEIANPLGDEHTYMRRSVVISTVSAGLMVVLCGLVAWLVGLLFVGRPVRRLVAQARLIGAGDLSGHVVLRQRDELGELAREMNDMAGALAHAQEHAQREASARVSTLEQLRHADRLRTVGTLASGLAHELGTPLNVVAGHAQLVLEDTAAGAAAHENARIVLRQADRMTRTVRQLLDFARAERRSEASASVADVVRQTLAMVEPLARARQVTARFEAGEGPLRARIASDDLQQALANVVMNGLQAMPDGGTLVIRLRRLRTAAPPGAEHERDMICIAVEDEGVGMTAETAERVFEPFFTTKEVGEGTGLGLAVAYGLVRERDGWIEVRSTPGHGSRFSIFVPAEAH